MTENLSEIADVIHQDFEIRTKIREQALLQARQLTRLSALSIRAIHREERAEATGHLEKARELVSRLKCP